MGFEQQATRAELERLRAEIAADRQAIDRHGAIARELLPVLGGTPTPGDLARAAVALHAWYTGLETILERTARRLEGAVPTGDRWRGELLSGSTVDVAGIRPAVVPRATYGDLQRLLSFRHFFRHAYVVDFDARELLGHLERLARVEPQVAAALDAFDAFLGAAADAVGA